MLEQAVEEARAPALSHAGTVEEFLDALHEDAWAEWVGGEVVTTSPASFQHQDLVRFLIALLSLYVEHHDLGWILSAPFPMLLAEQQRVREPDLLFLRRDHAERLRDNRLDGPADLVVEVVSPESLARDRGEKFVEYEAAGVAEYWLLDPQRRQLDLYHLGEDRCYHPLPATDGLYLSRALPDLRLDPDWFWQDPQPRLRHVAAELGLLG